MTDNTTIPSEPVDFDPNRYINTVNAAHASRKSGDRSSSKAPPPLYCNPIGFPIRNAVDGTIHKYKVGSKDEKRFWTVMVNNGKETAKLFYNNPEEYENHRGTTVTLEEKDAWKAGQETIRRQEVGLTE